MSGNCSFSILKMRRIRNSEKDWAVLNSSPSTCYYRPFPSRFSYVQVYKLLQVGEGVDKSSQKSQINGARLKEVVHVSRKLAKNSENWAMERCDGVGGIKGKNASVATFTPYGHWTRTCRNHGWKLRTEQE